MIDSLRVYIYVNSHTICVSLILDSTNFISLICSNYVLSRTSKVFFFFFYMPTSNSQCIIEVYPCRQCLCHVRTSARTLLYIYIYIHWMIDVWQRKALNSRFMIFLFRRTIHKERWKRCENDIIICSLKTDETAHKYSIDQIDRNIKTKTHTTGRRNKNW
jgi:hypothetical protein